jgi:hypothetical protein
MAAIFLRYGWKRLDAPKAARGRTMPLQDSFHIVGPPTPLPVNCDRRELAYETIPAIPLSSMMVMQFFARLYATFAARVPPRALQ